MIKKRIYMAPFVLVTAIWLFAALPLAAEEPWSRLHVDAGSTTPATIRVSGDSAGVVLEDYNGATDQRFVQHYINDGVWRVRGLTDSLTEGAMGIALNLENGRVGIGTSTPEEMLHIEADGNEKPAIRIRNTDAAGTGWVCKVVNVDEFRISKHDSAVAELKLDASGNLTIAGDITSGGTTYVPDYVFEPGYQLMPISELAAFIVREQHLPGIPSGDEIEAEGGINLSRMQMRLLEKLEELTLYTVGQQQTIDDQQEALSELRARLAALEQTAGDDQ